MIRVLVVDDHPLVTEGLTAILGAETDIEVVGVAGTADEAEGIARREAPDVVLMDLRLPGRSGAEAAMVIGRDHPGVAVIFLTAEVSEDAIGEAVRAGAVGYLVKGEPPSEIAGAIRRAAEGEMLIPAGVLARLLVTQHQTARDEAEHRVVVARFTPRERDVLAMMGQALDNEDIAERLFVELTTVRWHIRNILEKLGVHSKLAAVLRASELGLV
ncbi:MAG: hypothetical protein QOE92_783 [Chloroflexota bacterium]|jgi:DNA-binding NarL/FixJ family response regulator|nr:hypothetical protein [Chloroflexota bacterium]